jgi:aspartyl-tRNA synthetase
MNSTESDLLERTVGCGEVTEQDAVSAREVVVTGWVQRRRDLGQLIFVELRDRTGLLQVVVDPSESTEAHAVAETLTIESVIGVAGRIVPRESPNPRHPTGKVELRATRVVLHNRAESVPFPVDEGAEINEETRLTHRYVELRQPGLRERLRTRHRLAATARRVLDSHDFIEVETPILTRSTPEGARDYLVPSRVHPGSFYALPQSPQLFKQLLMVAGFERYYQLARCFRDEDLRADRQPEFTQVDIEMSFAGPERIYAVVEDIVTQMFREIGVEVGASYARMGFDEAVDRYGTDRPDTRFGVELRDAGEHAEGTGFKPFEEALGDGGSVRGIAVPGGGGASRKQLDLWTGWARDAGAGGLVWIKRADDGSVTSSALKHLGAERCARIAETIGAGKGDAALVVSAARTVCNEALGSLRLRVARDAGLIPEGKWNLLWIEDFPLVQWDAGERRWFSYHHPFTAPRWDQVEMLTDRTGEVRAQAYDLVLNGTEIGGGSIRIHRRDVQQRVFAALGIGQEEAESRFGFLLRALEAGAPPHGGIALGFDRICAVLTGADSIREVIAFPKTTSASCLMTGAPATVDEGQVAELGLATRPPRQSESPQ